MFNKLNFKDRLLLRFGINTFLVFILLIVIVLMFYSVDNNVDNWLNMALCIGFACLILIMMDFYLSKWSLNAITKPIEEASEYTIKAFQILEKVSVKLENSVNKQLKLIREAEEMVETLNLTSKETRDSAQNVADKSNKALEMSEKGQQSMHVNIKNMTILKQKIETIAEQILELSEHTQQIGSIVGVVEDITEQTNMLALNAAVEAARAGEHGRGFAIVASEIRKLADQIKQATTKIASLIYDIQQATNSTVMATEEGTKEIEAGVNLANQVAETINALRQTMQDTVEAVEAIVTASKEQFKFADEFSELMQSVGSGIKDSFETVEKSHNTIKTLEQVSDTLQEILLTESYDKTKTY